MIFSKTEWRSGPLPRVTSPPNSTSRRFTFNWPFSYISFSSFTFPGAPYRIFIPHLPRFPCHFYLVIEQQQQYKHTQLSRICSLQKYISIPNFIKLNQIWIVIILFWLTSHPTEFRLVLNKSEKCNYNPNLF